LTDLLAVGQRYTGNQGNAMEAKLKLKLYRKLNKVHKSKGNACAWMRSELEYKAIRKSQKTVIACNKHR
jgi:hypothetical protein